MKKIILLFLLLYTFKLASQNKYIGITGGVNFTNAVTNLLLIENNYIKCYSLGITYEKITKNNFSLGLDILYFQRGYSFFADNVDNSGNFIGQQKWSFNYNYFAVPLKVGYNFGSNIYGFVKIGLSPSFLLKAYEIWPGVISKGSITPESVVITTQNVEQFNLAYLFQIGGGFKLKNRIKMYTSFEYQHSLTNINYSRFYRDIFITHYGMIVSIGISYALIR